jgi:23S rRNA pseudouridine1911/1915/1917 synthase
MPQAELEAARFVVSERDRGARLDRFLKDRIPKLTRRRIQEAIGTRVLVTGSPGVTVPGSERRRARPALHLNPGDVVVVLWPPREPPPLDLALSVLYEDADLVVVDKPAGLPVHATRSVLGRHVIGWLRATRGSSLALAHRLDRETSGILIAVRSAAAARVLAREFASGAVHKEYLALVFGTPPERFTIDLPVGRDLRSAVYIKQAADRELGQPARTRFERLCALGALSLVRALPETGRRHQIRVHLQAAGHPIVGDKLYAAGERHFLNFIVRGASAPMTRELGAARHMLHAARVVLAHPSSGSSLTLESPLPADMQALVGAPSVLYQ